jgi:two-component system CheB/CheR fusion protein
MTSSPTSLEKHQDPAIVRIVGIGASAGGLDAFEQFFARVPVRSGLAYIVVQHLDPTKKAMLVELLQRVTTLSVREAGEQMRVEADHVYVIPPNVELRLAQGMLRLAPPAEARGMRLPVNVLFSSMARDQGASAIGVVLSGMGSDGTLGLQALKAVGGLTVVQEPSSAQFDSMPRSAIAAGCATSWCCPRTCPTASWPASLGMAIQRRPSTMRGPTPRRATRRSIRRPRPSTASSACCGSERGTTSRSTNPAR